MVRFESVFRVYYEDTDAGGIVYHANYLKFAERARSDWLRGLGYNQSTMMKERGLIFPVFELSVKYHKSARLDDWLRVETILFELKNVSMRFKQNIFCDSDLIATLEVGVACCDSENKVKKWPDDLRHVLSTCVLKK